MSTCDRCGSELDFRPTFRFDNKLACRSHLLEFRNIGTVDVWRGEKRTSVYSATQSELEQLVRDPTVTDIEVRSFEWVNKPSTVSRPLQVSKAYNRKARWITLKK